MPEPLFSVIIPTYKRSNLVGAAIEAVLRQSFADFELIVSDNHSTDDTEQVVASFGDQRLRLVQPPRHMVLPEHWDFARRQAKGKLVLILADDDGIVASLLERFADVHRRLAADLVFCKLGEYRDPDFGGPLRNTVHCPAFSGMSYEVDAADFLGPLFGGRHTFLMHPSAYAFDREMAVTIADRCGSFFQTNGVEYFAWPVAAAFARRIAHVDAPAAIVARTAKSWGTNMVLTNPGKKAIAAFVSDMRREWKHSPVTNFTFANLVFEGILTAKALFPEELSGYEINERAHLTAILGELVMRESQGVDVSAELTEIRAYAAAHPDLGSLDAPLLPVASVGARAARKARRLLSPNGRREVVRAKGRDLSGDEHGFHDILSCADYLEGLIESPGDLWAPSKTVATTQP